METAALVIVCAFALWIAAAGAVAVAKPLVARSWIGRFATSHVINVAEQAWRGLAGAALIVRAPLSATPQIFVIAGWILVLSAVALLAIPLRWHFGYARWWSRNLPLLIVRAAGLTALAAAMDLVLSAM